MLLIILSRRIDVPEGIHYLGEAYFPYASEFLRNVIDEDGLFLRGLLSFFFSSFALEVRHRSAQ